jgi:hypothetical protein
MADLTDGKKEELREAYLSNASLTLDKLAKESEGICGIKVSLEALKIISWTDGWGVIKRRQQLGKEGEPLDVADEADDLRQILYARIVNPDIEISATDMANLVRTWEIVRAVSPRKTSGKSSRQQVIDSTRIGIEAVMQLMEERDLSSVIEGEDENPPS